MKHVPVSVVDAINKIAKETGTVFEFVCGIAADQFLCLPYKERRGFCMQYFCLPHGLTQTIEIDVDIFISSTGRGMSKMQSMLTAIWVFTLLPNEDAVMIVNSYGKS